MKHLFILVSLFCFSVSSFANGDGEVIDAPEYSFENNVKSREDAKKIKNALGAALIRKSYTCDGGVDLHDLSIDFVDLHYSSNGHDEVYIFEGEQPLIITSGNPLYPGVSSYNYTVRIDTFVTTNAEMTEILSIEILVLKIWNEHENKGTLIKPDLKYVTKAKVTGRNNCVLTE